MKTKKILAVSSAVIIGATSTINSLPTAVYAQENTDMIIVEEAKKEVNLTAPNKGQTQGRVTDEVKSKKIYVKTFASEGGDGSEARPFNNFKTAYDFASENDTLVLLNAVTIQNDDNFSDQGVFTFKKAINIIGDNSGNGVLSSRVPVQLGANVKFENMEFFASNIYLNGHTLEMNNVKNFKNNTEIPSVYGGAYKNGTDNKGVKSVLKVDGYVGDSFKFKTIYAGSEIGESDIPVTLELNKGVNVEDGIYADGVNGKVNANVEFNIGQISASKFENNYATSNATIIFNGYDKIDGPILKGFNDVILKNSRIKVKNANEFLDIKGKLELDSKSKLDISNLTTPFSVGSFVGEDGSLLILNETGNLEVKGELKGTVELRTPGVDIATSGVVKKDHIYISATQTSSGNVTFKPFFNQRNLELKKENGQATKNWVIRSKQVDNPIEKLDIVEDKNVKIEKDTEQEFTLKYYDKDGNELKYEPQFEFEIKDPTGKLVSYDKVEVFSDVTPDKILVYVYDDTIEAGNYTIVITEVVSNKTFEIPFKFYKDNQQTSYTVEFNANGGIGNMVPQSIELNNSTKLSKNTFTRAGYTFKGWSKQPNGNVEYTDEEEIQNLTNIAGEKVVLYAVWTKNWLDINVAPTINAADKVLTVGDNFNPLDGVTAFDKEDGDIKLTKDNVIANNVNMDVAGTYNVTYKVTDKNGASVVKTITVVVKDKEANKPITPEKPPVENNQIVNVDNGEEIVFDIAKPTNIKIISSKLENKEVEYILINGIKVTRRSIEDNVTRSISAYATEEYFTTANGSITLSAKLFEDLNLDVKEGYNIGVGFVDGSKIADLVKLNVVDSSIDNTVTPPVEDNGDNSNTGSNSNNVNKPDNENESGDESNSTTNKLPNTGTPVGTGALSVLGMLSAFVGTKLLKKKK